MDTCVISLMKPLHQKNVNIMKSVLKSITLSLFVVFLYIGPAMAQTVVKGTGMPEQDVRNVQKAVDRGGEVLLKGHFNFGPAGRVTVRKTVSITGDVDGIGLPVTTITGGFWSFYSPLPVHGAPPGKKGPRITIQSLHFQGAKGTPMHFPFASGVTVENCTVEHLLPQELNIKWAEASTLDFVAGVVVGTLLDHHQAPLRNAVQGVVTIKNNRFHMMVDRPRVTDGKGIMVDYTWGAIISIENNIVTKASRNAIEVFDNTRSGDTGSIHIFKNKIITDSEGIPHPNTFTPNGIAAGWFYDTAGGADVGRNCPTTITENRIELRGKRSTGLLIFCNDALAAGNDIVFGGGVNTLGIVQTGSRGFIAYNRFRGNGEYAVFTVAFENLAASGNLIAWNNMKDFTGNRGQIKLNGTLNRVLGEALINDRGKGNTHMDIKPVQSPGKELEGEDWEPVETLP